MLSIFLDPRFFREDAAFRAEVERFVAANAAGYFWEVYVALEGWRPGAEGPYALALAILYRLAAADYAAIEKGMIEIDKLLEKPDVDAATALVKEVLAKYQATHNALLKEARSK